MTSKQYTMRRLDKADGKNLYTYDKHANQIIELAKGTPFNGWYLDEYGRRQRLIKEQVYFHPLDAILFASVKCNDRAFGSVTDFRSFKNVMQALVTKYGKAIGPDNKPMFCTMGIGKVGVPMLMPHGGVKKSPIGILIPCADQFEHITEWDFFQPHLRESWQTVFPWITTDAVYDKFLNFMCSLERMHDRFEKPEWGKQFQMIGQTYAEKDQVPIFVHTPVNPNVAIKYVGQVPEIFLSVSNVPLGSTLFFVNKKLRTMAAGILEEVQYKQNALGTTITYVAQLASGSVLPFTQEETFFCSIAAYNALITAENEYYEAKQLNKPRDRSGEPSIARKIFDGLGD